MLNLQNLKLLIFKYKVLLAVVVLSLFGSLSIGLFLNNQQSKQTKAPTEQVLGAAASPSPSSSPTPSPSSSPSLSPRPRAVSTPKPSPSPSLSPSPSSNTSSSTSQTSSNPTPTPTPTPQPSPTPSTTPTPSPAALSLEIHIDYTGASDRPADTYTSTFTQGQTAWDIMKSAIGEGNIAYTQYSFGVFITGINGVNATGNQFWEFVVNGQSASVGVSDYVCNNGDNLQFKISTF